MKEPRLNRIEESQGTDEALVLIKGYLSEKEHGPDDSHAWAASFREVGWKGAIYQVWWDALSFSSLVQRLLMALPRSALPIPFKIPGLLVKAGISVTVLLSHWIQAKNRAKTVGQDYLPEMLHGISESTITLVGVSLGVRIAYYTLTSFEQKQELRMKDVLLLGGAVARDESKDWPRAVEPLRGNMVNVYNRKDHVLRYLYRIAQIPPKSPCGLKPIKAEHPKIINVDGTHELGGSLKNHWEYLNTLPRIIGSFFQDRPLIEARREKH